MSENDRQDSRSPLISERGSTIIDRRVVSQLADMAAGEVEGIYLGSGTSRAAGSLLSRPGASRGISVEVGRIETALDLTVGIDYGKDILKTIGEVRRRIVERVESMTGLRVTELNVTVSDIVIPELEETRRTAMEAGTEETSTTNEPGKDDETAELEAEESQAEERPASGGDEPERRVR